MNFQSMLTKQDNRSYYMDMLTSQKKEAKKDTLLNHGVKMLMQQGYHGTGLQEILDAASIPKGSFYNYFSSKEDFGAAVIQHYIDPYIRQLSACLQQPEADAFAAIVDYFNQLVSELEHNDYQGGCLLGNLMGEIGDTSEVCQKSLQTAVERYRDLLQAGLARAQQQGTIRRDKSAKEMADLLINTWQGALLRSKIDKSSAPAKQCCQDLLGDYFRA
ncbi:TetR family transcriptional regulator C-terminal domain-containing protein [Nitrosomonas sp. ANs5]|uniref:TetR/AcrR family transcriptional regulator n=1 Tax=Nitrosomonas sp. ANs5 TaxID=3423941 RepID=UPI003D330955